MKEVIVTKKNKRYNKLTTPYEKQLLQFIYGTENTISSETYCTAFV